MGQQWGESTAFRAFFRPATSAAQGRLQARFLAALTESLSQEANELAIPGSEWTLELLSGDGHLCPVVNLESHQGFLRPVGTASWTTHELHCAVDWTCNLWCRQRSDRTLADAQMLLAGQRDPAATCDFCAHFSSLQGRFGVAAVRIGARSREPSVMRAR